MRVAALYDIHGNLHALEAVLEEVEREDVGLIVIGGDVAWGPFPSETVDVLLGLDGVELVRGNADREVGARLDIDDGLDPTVAAINTWCADQLTQGQRDWLDALPTSVSLRIKEIGSTLFCHGSPRSDEESLTVLTSDARMKEVLTEVTEGVVVCGHTHMQFDRTLGRKRVVNAGSVGLPYQQPGGAYWALLGPDVDLRRTDYDVTKAVAAMRATDCPHVEDMFVDPLLHPPDPDEIARQFEPEPPA